MEEIDITTIPDEFKELLRSKLKKQDTATYEEALRFFSQSLLGYYTIMKAAPGSIDLDEIREARRKVEREKEERRARYEEECRYESGLTWLYQHDTAVGYYAGVDKAGIIRLLCYESGDHRSGGAIYSNTPFSQYGDFNSEMNRIKAEAPELYTKLSKYRQA